LRSNAIREHRQPKRRDKTIAAFAANPIITAETVRPGGGLVRRRGGRETKAEREMAIGNFIYCLSMIFSDLASPAVASAERLGRLHGFAQAGNRYPPRIKSGAGFFGIML
jgi:hypothetical protein